MRRKQTSIRFSRSALPHRYLRYISWISWNGGHRPPRYRPSTSWVSTPCCGPRPRHFRRCLYPKAATAALLLLLPPRREQLLSDFPPRKRKTILFLSLTRFSHVAPPILRHPRAPTRAACDPSAAGLSPAVHVAFCGPPINKKMRAHGIAPRTRKKRRLLAQENTRRHARLTRSCFGRKNLFIDGPHSLLPFFLSPFLQRKRKKKTEANSAGSNTSLGLTSFVLTMYAIGPSRLVR